MNTKRFQNKVEKQLNEFYTVPIFRIIPKHIIFFMFIFKKEENINDFRKENLM